MDIKILSETLGQCIIEIESFNTEVTLIVDRRSILTVCDFLKNDPRFLFDFLSDCCGVDRFPESPRYWVVYHIYSIAHNHRVSIKASLDDAKPVIDSVVSIWQSADWMERECYDMFGIEFRNHPDMRRILMPDDFQGFPLRKDFPLEGLE
ncbi:MAG: NADH-quinone oxidoreductase subunit C [Deltaproteobacteria bacterium]|nr:NADH-quinone oxidoreductase subunit C [Deltaproteobacteria bacterium]